MPEQAQLLIKGHVQGVFYRATTKQQADKLGIKGWVRNLPGGQVEVLAQGDREAIQKLIAWCHQGPAGARVDKVTVTASHANDHYFDFVIR
jgi:acylphosphatase